ncbi:MAG: DUF1800 domain-containing protein [Planctomycetota bacterium]|nr:MAG: DUF1800 domain-containing protein [Planctomycetota bacterium]
MVAAMSRFAKPGCFAIGVVALVAWSSRGEAAPPVTAEPQSARVVEAEGLARLDPGDFDRAKARHLLSRAGFGGTPDEARNLHALGLEGAVDKLVEFRDDAAWDLPIDVESAFRDGRDPKSVPPEERRRLDQERRKKDAAQLARLRAWWMQRMIASPRPLEEKLTLFWHGHFATEHQVVRDSYALWVQNQMLRTHADDFAALLRGIVRDPAMLRYLDNNRNERRRPNENLAREIMELFSMGEGNYTEQDIREAARALTGYTFVREAATFRFAKNKHDEGEKTIFGEKGRYDGDGLVDLILRQPQTSRFVAAKLFAFFAHDSPSEETIERLSTLVRRHEFRLAPVLKNLFMSAEFYSSRAMGTQVKSPIQLVVGTYRVLGIEEGDFAAGYQAARNMGQDLFQPPNVKGWPGGRDWINSRLVFARYNSLANLVDPSRRGKRQAEGGFDVIAAVEARRFANAGEVVDYLAGACLSVPLAESKRQALIDYLDNGRPFPASKEWDSKRDEVNARLRAVLVLMICMPEYQVT